MAEKEIQVVQNIFDENDRIAFATQEKLGEMGVFVVNIMGAPGAGKTSSIINLIQQLSENKVYVIEGDIESDIDTVKLKELGIEAIQINTNGACHLDAPTIQSSLDGLSFDKPGLLFIENIGNLVCPAEFQIGEHIKMLICSAAEGSDKPYKYPLAFEKADVILLTKCDLKTYVDFNDEFFLKGVRALNKTAPVFEVNAKTGQGFEDVAEWLLQRKG
ncbi:NiFe hydrogenase nickel incorporation-associated protein HypB [Dehalobacter sp. UNSWDHB]|uniref:hydrogenase nickel incorporation protein HypB n=1 Tax=unclassified Dehalobacter TaxID=2635733 RepID=UPI00028A4736|nr:MULTISPECIES: hydrogenase nickel incorporation protein HypB [unclassified Dehalobacter]AFV01806.1 [NiFe] hydrogenase nickel incorporation-associated protein HypB [Dehalobacter sp. DCA]AFV04842.1 [NiFe] hydrogenase nickel incorporation-associated protein HypB [Dehalobacter sp. CF]EQB21601.1 NiFe hydrogenase nickel incorporation-associated protein HypB [Dehalobacter sp. UNSWDHB]